MISDHRCFFCFTRAFEKLLEKENISNEAKKSFTFFMVSFILIMNAGSLSLQKLSGMKASILVKIFFFLPLLIFVDYILMAILGCTTCLFGFGEDFYCCSFCQAGKIILVLSAIFFGNIISPDIKAIFKPERDGTSA